MILTNILVKKELSSLQIFQAIDLYHSIAVPDLQNFSVPVQKIKWLGSCFEVAINVVICVLELS